MHHRTHSDSIDLKAWIPRPRAISPGDPSRLIRSEKCDGGADVIRRSGVASRSTGKADVCPRLPDGAGDGLASEGHDMIALVGLLS
jgi:hypothetical protein